jgi:hypothetical protein
MPLWRCPHCGTPQAESSRCWVCKRSSTSCGTCRHFRRSVAGGLGYCGLDPRRLPLRGEEIRGCWEAPVAAPPAPVVIVAPRRVDPRIADAWTNPAPLDFIPVDDAPAPSGRSRRSRRRAAATADGSAPPADPMLGFWSDEA